ncbi:hypothetical protein V7139_27780 [Neobacillus drentensis]|uniref:hypothetical protein n=1 Tax=Neobacillus drentensis TaxID=220684 RepID=UPI00300368C6
MSEQGRKDTEEMEREIKKLITTLFVGRFRAPKNTRIDTYEWESVVIDQDLGKQFIMVTKVLENGGLDMTYLTVDNDEQKDIEESVRALHKKMNFILRNSRVFQIGELESL